MLAHAGGTRISRAPSIGGEDMSELYCEASINYLSTEGPVPVPVKIYDARRETELSWQTSGFELQVLSSRVENWADRAQIDAVHYDEVSGWARRESGCEKVLFFPGLLRNPAAEAQSPDFAPIQAAHSDYTESYGDMIADPDHPYHRVLAPSMARAGVSAADLQSASRVLTLQLCATLAPRSWTIPWQSAMPERCLVRSSSRCASKPTGAWKLSSMPSGSSGAWVVMPTAGTRFHRCSPMKWLCFAPLTVNA